MDGPAQGVKPVGRGTRAAAVVGCQLIFQRAEYANVMHATLLVERAHRLHACELAARGMHGGIRNRRFNRSQRCLDQVAAVVHFTHDAIGAPVAISSNRLARPLFWRIAAGEVIENEGIAQSAQARDDDPCLVRVRPEGDGRIDGHDNALQR